MLAPLANGMRCGKAEQVRQVADRRLKRVSKPLPTGAAHIAPARAGTFGGK